MMLLTDKGTSYSEGFFELRDGRVYNSFTGLCVGVLVRKIPSTTYLFIRKNTLFNRIIKKWKRGDKEAYKRVHKIPLTSTGSLVETMRLLEENK